MTSTDSSLACPARWSTPRTDRPTRGPEVAQIAEALGQPLMPWQQHVADVALEVDPDTGRLVYREVRLTVPRQSGKGLALDTKLPTPSGWVAMGDVAVGDKLFDDVGQPCSVTYVSEDRNLDCYLVEFSDGTSVVADGDHLWSVFDIWLSGGSRSAPNGRWVTLSTREMVGKAAVGTRGKSESRYRLPDSASLSLEDADLPIDPYLFGMWLGDGSSSSGVITVGKGDLDHVVSAVRESGWDCVVSHHANRAPSVRIHSPDGRWSPTNFSALLRSLDVFRNKHIPAIYLRASRQQRLELLQGLMDTDGTVTVNGTAKRSRGCEFSVVNEQLARNVAELLRSLGIRVTFRQGPATLDGRVVGTRYRLIFVTDQQVFRLPRKRDRHLEQQLPLRKRNRTIKNVTPVPTVATRCIQVDSASHLFLCGEGMVATHNTTLMLALMIHRCVAFGGKQRVGYTAQTGQAARAKFIDDHVPVVSGSMFGQRARVRRANGSEAILWKNGSIWSVLPTTETAGHGAQYDLAVCDEAFALPDDRLEQAFKPTMITRPEPQLWIVSTAGDVNSHWFNAKVDDGRLLADRGVTDGVAYFEWSAPEDADPSAEDTWRACMPALGHTIQPAAIRADFESMRLVEFRRAYLNQRQNRNAVEPWQVIAEDTWKALEDPRSRIADEPVLALDVTPDRSAAAIAAAGRRKDGKLHVEVIEHRQGTGWVVDWFAERKNKYGPVIVDPAGPAGPLVAMLTEAGVEVRTVAARWHAHACGQFYDAAATDRMRHLGQVPLEVALAGASQRHYGELWLWSRKDLTTDMCPLVACTLALGGVFSPGDEPEVPVRVVSLADLD